MSAFVTDGTVAVTNGSRTIVGTGTAWNDVVAAGNLFFDQTGSAYGIRTVNSDTELTLNVPYRLGSGLGLTYEIDTTRGAERELAQGVATLLGRYQAYPDIAVRFDSEILPEMRADVATLIVDTQATLAAALSTSTSTPIYNLLPDSGRLVSPKATGIPVGAFAAPAFFVPFNGGTGWAEVGKFIHSNSNFGGPGGTMTEPVVSLLTHAGDTRSSGSEWYVAERTTGNGTALGSVHEGVSYYGISVNNGIALPYQFTVGLFVRIVSGAVIVASFHEQDGASSPAAPLPTGSWRYVRAELEASNGSNNIAPSIRATPGTVIQIALPSVVPGHAARVDHTKALPIIAAGALA